MDVIATGIVNHPRKEWICDGCARVFRDMPRKESVCNDGSVYTFNLCPTCNAISETDEFQEDYTDKGYWTTTEMLSFLADHYETLAHADIAFRKGLIK